MSTVPFPAPSPGERRRARSTPPGATRRAMRRLTLGSGPLKRTSDRIEMLSRLLLVAALALAAPASVVVATAVEADLSAAASQQAASRSQVVAVLLEDATLRGSADSLTSAWATGSWTAPDGTARWGSVPGPESMRAGDAVRIWIDGQGGLTGAPLRDSDVTAGSAVAGGVSFVLVVAAASTAHALVCWTLNRRRDRQWSAGWAEVEPTWSGRQR